MKDFFTLETEVSLSQCDHKGYMSIPAMYAQFMDIATYHAEVMGVGFDDMAPRHLFWLAVRSRIHIERKPRISDQITVMTWPEVPGRMRCMRSYRISQGDEVLVEGRTEWGILNTETGMLAPAKGMYPPDMVHDTPPVEIGPFVRVKDDWDDAEVIGQYKVRATDIDLGQHMNNAAYIPVMTGAFSSKDWDEKDYHTIDVTFRKSCYEGDVLNIETRPSEHGLYLRFAKDGTTIFVAELS